MADNGQLDANPMRAKAHDIEKAMQKHANDRAVGTSLSGSAKTKVDWHAAMELLEHADEVIKHLQEYLELKDRINVETEAPPES
jgi:hypothetical protein